LNRKTIQGNEQTEIDSLGYACIKVFWSSFFSKKLAVGDWGMGQSPIKRRRQKQRQLRKLLIIKL